MANKTAKELLPEVMVMVESDVMKARHYLDKAVQVAIKADDLHTANDIAIVSVGLSLYLTEITNITERLKTEVNHGW